MTGGEYWGKLKLGGGSSKKGQAPGTAKAKEWLWREKRIEFV